MCPFNFFIHLPVTASHKRRKHSSSDHEKMRALGNNLASLMGLCAFNSFRGPPVLPEHICRLSSLQRRFLSGS